MFRNVVYLALAGATLGSSGCSTAIKQALYTTMGAEGKFYEVQVVNPSVLSGYQSVRVEPFANALGKRVPPDVVAGVNQNAPKTVTEARLFQPTGRLVRVTGTIIHFTGRSGLDGAIGSVIGGDEECVCRVQLLDGESGELIGEAICWGVVKSAVRRGPEEMGVGVGRGVVKWLEERLPDEVKKTRRQDLESG